MAYNLDRGTEGHGVGQIGGVGGGKDSAMSCCSTKGDDDDDAA